MCNSCAGICHHLAGLC
ncbi:hypothetical protein [Butyrivibrio proteoclasticus]